MVDFDTLHPGMLYFVMSDDMDSGRDGIHSDIGEEADRILVGKGHQQMNVHFDRAQNWDEEREVLTDRQRIRDLETYLFGDRRGFTIGIMRQMRSHMLWLVVLSIFQFVAVLMQAVLVWSILRGGI